ncbi:type II toxin-antitoxin system VapC family toxin [Candidatus Desantisbacteria bacterium]|nr:type II toxin-antitoxin system VapC family toxin [Candidatus Desantisbacteria bacterium]
MNYEKYLFDTDVITNILKKQPSQNLISCLNKLKYEQQYISTITISEIVYGALKSIRPEYHLNNLNKILLPTVNILNFDSASAFIYGEIRVKLEKKGTLISHTDMQIASIAMSNNITLITGNIKHFERIENLKIDNWLKDHIKKI